jgi:hypothetical protein
MVSGGWLAVCAAAPSKAAKVTMTTAEAAARANTVVALHNAGPVDSGSQRRATLLRLYFPAQDRARIMTFGRAGAFVILIGFDKNCVLFEKQT